MTLSLTWLGHATFEVQLDETRLLIDPFLTGNPAASAAAATLNPTVILLTHGHGDHSTDVADIARRTGARVVTNVEIGRWLNQQGVTHVDGINYGGTLDLGAFTVKAVLAQHSSSLPDGSYGGNPLGFVITRKADGRRVYYAGDTNLFTDMQLIGNLGLDVAILPIGDYFTMGLHDSVLATQLLRPRVVIPMHFNTFDKVQQNVAAWADMIRAQTEAQPVVLTPGETHTFEG